MSAETLRKAAALMRERAEAVSGRLGWWDAEDLTRVVSGATVQSHEDDVADAEHIASWHPAVSIEVAEWLEFTADHHDTLTAAMETGETNLSPTAINSTTGMGHALAVARAYLGGTA